MTKSNAETVTLHQWWGGGNMPISMSTGCNSVKSWAEHRGWNYHLWSRSETEQRFAGEATTRILARCRQTLPSATTEGFASDWWRLRILAEFGGVWLDTDYEVQNEATLNSWIPSADMAFMGEGWRPELPSTGCLWCNGRRGHAAARIICSVAREALQRLLPLDAPDFSTRFIQMARTDTCFSGIAAKGIGPRKMREEFLPAMVQAGFCFEVIPSRVCCDRRQGTNTGLLHIGGALWRETQADWNERARKAKVEDFNASLPSWLKPQSKAARVLPKVGRRSDMRRRDMGASPVDGFRIPRGTKRIIIFSNIPCFDPARANLREGDFCIHCNRSIHHSTVRTIPGTTHVALVRHGEEASTREWCWFEPSSTNELRQIIHVDDEGMSSRRTWWRMYRAVTGKTPTTGFIAWHLAQEAVAPSVPIILAGFAPGERKGTPLWDGHAWSYEAETYRKAGVQIIAP